MATDKDSIRTVENGVVKYTRPPGQKRNTPSRRGRALTDEQIDGVAEMSEDDLSKAIGGVSVRNVLAGKSLGQKRRNGHGTPRNLDVMLRRAKALELRRAGFTWQEIANRKSLGYNSPRQAQRDVFRLLQELVDVPAQEVLALELSRLDAITQAIWQNVRNGDLWAVDRILNAMRMRQELLGLHKIKIDHSVVSVDDLDREIARLTAEMRKLDPEANIIDGHVTSVSDTTELEEARKAAGL